MSHKRTRPSLTDIRGYWHSLRDAADKGDAIAQALLIALYEGRPIFAAKPEGVEA